MSRRCGWRPPLAALAGVLFAVAHAGCSVKVGTREGASFFRVRGLVNGYVTADALQPYDGTVLEFGVLDHSVRHGELVSAELWPIVGFGVGLVGVRVRALFMEVGVGTLFYDPRPPPEEAERPAPEPEEGAEPDLPAEPEREPGPPGEPERESEADGESEAEPGPPEGGSAQR